MAVDLLPARGPPGLVLPSLALATAQTPGSSGAWSVWAEVVASTSVPMVLCGIYIQLLFQVGAGLLNAGCLNIQVGIGAALSEVVIGETVPGSFAGSGGLTGSSTAIGSLSSWFAPTHIPAGTRIAVRSSSSTTAGMAFSLYLAGYNATTLPNPLRSPRLARYLRGLSVPTQGTVAIPSPGLTSVTSGGSLWTYGSWVQFIASASAPMLITTVNALGGTISRHAQAQVGVGGAGSEVAIACVGFPGRSGVPGPSGRCPLYRPLFVNTGEAVSVRVAANAASYACPVSLTAVQLL